MDIAVVGCGPAGLAAAHAAHGLGAGVTIISPMEMSPQLGPLVLQRPIPGITLDHPDAYIRQIVIGGSILDYRYRLYGDININISRSSMLKEGYHCWNHIKAYEAMWKMYMATNERAQHIKMMIEPAYLRYIATQYDLVVNTAPLRSLCYQKHEFVYKPVQVTFGYSYPDQPENTTIFNAGSDYEWVRSAYLLGNASTEWLPGTAPSGLDPITIRKPIRHNCNCYKNVLGTGRFGAWRNETWVDTAYYDVRDAIMSMQLNDTWNRVQ